MDRCEIPRCRDEASIVYLGRGVCERHWNKYTADDVPDSQLRMVLGLTEAQDAAVDGGRAMDGEQKGKAGEQAEAPAKGKAKAAGKATKKATPKAEAVAKPGKERKTREREQFDGEVVVFAFRLGSNDRDRIHAASGPAGATRFVRSAALAASSGDRAAFDALVAQAKANLK